MVLGDGVLVHDKGVLTIVRGQNRYVGQSVTLERMLTTEMLQCLVKSRKWEKEQEPFGLS